MKTAFSAAVLAAGALAADIFHLEVFPSFGKNDFGFIVDEDVSSEGQRHTTVHAHIEPVSRNYEVQANHLDNAAKLHESLVESNGASPQYHCTQREPSDHEYNPSDTGMFFPVFSAQVSPANPVATYEGDCFEEIKFEFQQTSDTAFDIVVTPSGRRSFMCTDTILFGNTEIQHFEIYHSTKEHRVSFEMNTPDAMADVAFGGMKMFSFCDGIKDTLVSLFKFVEMFIGGQGSDHDKPIFGSHIPKYQLDASLNFLEKTMGLEAEARETQVVTIDPELVQSGDFFAVNRMDGLDPLIMYGTGSMIGHSIMALRMDGELYVVESYGADFRPQKGIIKTKWADFIQQMQDSDCFLAWLPLKQEIRDKFNTEAAIDFFHQNEGSPYGIFNFLYGWIDTPIDNWPPMLPRDLAVIVFTLYESFNPSMAYDFFTQGINLRLGTELPTIADVAAEAARREMSLQDVMAQVEQDGWIYTEATFPAGQGASYVCSAFVAGLYKAAGLFDDLDVNATEFVPKNIYELDFFDMETPRPQACIDADPTLPFCQLNGTHRMYLPYLNTVTPYEHMNESCPINWPTYSRDEGC